MLHPLELYTYRSLRTAAACDGSPPDRKRCAAPRLALVLCLSGGRDSTALLHALVAITRSPLAAKLPELSLHAIHFNHEKRGQASDEDESFVKQLCAHLEVPCRTERLSQTGPDTHANFQDAARRWRHARSQIFLDEILATQDDCAGWVATGHHARDHAESLLLHLARGSGLTGLQGLTPHDATRRLLRPWADVPFEEIVKYAAVRHLAFREDASNASTDYRRNLVRHRLLPILAELNPAYEKALLRLSRNVREALAPEASPFTTATVRAQAETHGADLLRVLTRNSIENIVHHAHLHLQNSQRPSRIPLGEAWWAVLDRGTLRFERGLPTGEGKI